MEIGNAKAFIQCFEISTIGLRVTSDKHNDFEVKKTNPNCNKKFVIHQVLGILCADFLFEFVSANHQGLLQEGRHS